MIIPYSINYREVWNEFVRLSKNGTFLMDRGFMDYHADRFMDCSVLVVDDTSISSESGESGLKVGNVKALLPANWCEEERCVYSHQGLTYGGLLVREDATQMDVLAMMQQVLLYYENYMRAQKFVYKPIPYIYTPLPAEEDLYALYRAGAQLSHRLVSTVINPRHPLRMRTLRIRQSRKAIDHGFYIDRMTENDWGTLHEYWLLLEDVLRTHHNTRPVHTMEEMQLLMERFPKNIRLFIVNKDGRVVAGTIVFESRQVAHFQYIAVGDEGREYGALDLLFRYLVNERYCQMEYIDFGTSNEMGGLVLNAGLIFQKEGFGGRAVCYDTYEVCLDTDMLQGMLGEKDDEASQKIKYLDLKAVTRTYEPQLGEAVQNVVGRGWFLLGKENAAFEVAFSEYVGVEHCVLTANGLESLILILSAYKQMMGWAEGDEVLVPANTYIATILAVSRAGLTPVLTEPSIDTYLMNPDQLAEALTSRTRAVLPVHLYGRVCDMDRINAFAVRHGLVVVDDVAQAHGASWHGRRAGSLASASAFSFYPGKNLGALGDAGCVCTNDAELARLVRIMANYGSCQKYVNEVKGFNSRCDELQAAVLGVKLPRLDADNERRRQIARLYHQGIQNPLVVKPTMPDDIREHVYHIYAIRCPERDRLQAYLYEHGIQTLIHYPIPPHKQQAYSEWNALSFPITERIHREELSLPISITLTDAQVDRIIKVVNDFI